MVKNGERDEFLAVGTNESGWQFLCVELSIYSDSNRRTCANDLVLAVTHHMRPACSMACGQHDVQFFSNVTQVFLSSFFDMRPACKVTCDPHVVHQQQSALFWP